MSTHDEPVTNRIGIRRKKSPSSCLGRTRYENRANLTTGGWSPTRASPKGDGDCNSIGGHRIRDR